MKLLIVSIKCPNKKIENVTTKHARGNNKTKTRTLNNKNRISGDDKTQSRTWHMKDRNMGENI